MFADAKMFFCYNSAWEKVKGKSMKKADVRDELCAEYTRGYLGQGVRGK